MTSIAGKVAVITGAASGIGRALSYELARRGAKLAISDVDEVGVTETARHARVIGATVHEQRLDVTDRAAVLAYADTVVDEFGTVNIVVNNAGVAFTGDIEDMTFEQLERVMDVDYWGVVNGTKAFLPHLIASGDGHVVNVSSLFGILAVPGQSAYNSAKFAVRGFTEALRQEMIVAGHPVEVTCVHPGGIKTAIARNAGAVDGKDPAEIAHHFDTKLAKTSAESAARIITRAIVGNKPRTLVGLDAKVLDVIVRLLGSRYQRLFSSVGEAGGAGDGQQGRPHARCRGSSDEGLGLMHVPRLIIAAVSHVNFRLALNERRSVRTQRRLTELGALSLRPPRHTQVEHIMLGGCRAERSAVLGRTARCSTCTVAATWSDRRGCTARWPAILPTAAARSCTRSTIGSRPSMCIPQRCRTRSRRSASWSTCTATRRNPLLLLVIRRAAVSPSQLRSRCASWAAAECAGLAVAVDAARRPRHARTRLRRPALMGHDVR